VGKEVDHPVCYSDIYVRYCGVNSPAFLRRAKRYAKRHDLAFEFDPRHGKGSHGRILPGERITAIKSSNKALGPGLLRKMLKDLGIDPREF
jgi:hypothetical protein